ncbi:pkinase-domain-containing protein [Phaffia rhodozyma]|uniref:cyclin-dependent kinase n=1 Tax=Phaffia rhodozyma TaxID=264483 RepID=A0A0F7SSM1_PHARH|nr:pkinase-domain-containing protein [Phaffia rhodozyma]
MSSDLISNPISPSHSELEAKPKPDTEPASALESNFENPVSSTTTASTPEFITPSTSSSTAEVAVEASRKRSKWEDQAAREDELAIKIRKKNKLAAQERRRRERSAEERERESRLAAPSTSNTSSQYALSSVPPATTKPSTPRSREVPTISTRSAYVPSRSSHPSIQSCRSVYEYERLNHIEEGSYGVVFRAREKTTGEIVAIKKLKLDEEKNGFPITSLREVMALMVCRHENVVGVREIVVGDTLTQIFIVMDFIEHDLKSLLSIMPAPFVQSEVKTLLHQLLSATAHCHTNWILHRDLKTSNLLMNNRGMIKVADFGLARKFGEPLGDMTQLVVTLWYRSPELLLGKTDYSTAVDMWSIGCIFAELMLKTPLFQGKGEIEQIGQILKLLGYPNEDTWPGWSTLPLAKTINFSGPSSSSLPSKFRHLTETGLDLLSQLLYYDPERRISAEEAMRHPYFLEAPLPKHPSLFSSFPSQAAGERRQKPFESPSAPNHRHERD